MEINYKKISFLVIIGIVVVLLGGAVIFSINHSKYNLPSFLTASLLIQPTPIGNQSSANFAILAGSGITFGGAVNTTTITGDIGTYQTDTITGLENVVLHGTNHAGDSVTQAAKTDLGIAYDNASQEATPLAGADNQLGLAGTLLPGVYSFGEASTANLTTTLTLDGQGDPNAVFIFRASSTLVTAGSSNIILANRAQACNVFWQVGSSATLGASSFFKGNIMASVSAGLGASANVEGSVLAKTGAVTLVGTNTITNSACAPSLLLQKAVAGSADDPTTWTLKADGAGDSPTNLSGATGTDGANSDSNFSDVTFKADTYTLTEIPATTANYATTYSCANVNKGVTTTTTSSSITLVAGDKATCIITNTYTAPVNGACGTASINAPISHATYPYLGGPDTFTGVYLCSAGTAPADQTLASTSEATVTWVCTGQNGGYNTGTNGIPACTATRAAAPTPVDGACGTASINAPISHATYPYPGGPDTFTSAQLCSAGTAPADQTLASTSGATVTWVCAGQNGGYDTGTNGIPACTSTRVVAATLTLVKTIVGGSKTFADFPLTAIGANTGTKITGNSDTSPLTITNAIVPADTYALSETTQSNYTAGSWSCLKNDTLPAVIGASIQLASGNSAICTIQNTYIAPSSGGGGGNSYVTGVPVAPLIDVVKVPSPLALPNGPGPVTYTYTLRNIGIVPVINITMVDDTCSPITLISGDSNNDTKLDLNETWIYRCSKTLSATHTNTVVATGWANGVSATDIATATVVVGVPIVPPLIHVTKVPNPLTLPTGGGMVTYTKKVTNPGTVALSNVQIADDKCVSVKYISGDTNNDSKLDPTETWTYTCQANLTKTTTNTVTVSGQANGLTARDFAIATVIVARQFSTSSIPNTGFNFEGESTTWNFVTLFGMLIKNIIFSEQVRPGLPTRLKIPEINVDAAIEHLGLTPKGVMDVPKGPVDVAWLNLGPRPGEIGNAVIAGHYGTWENGEGSVFDDLNKLIPGDRIYVKDEKGIIITFVVRELRTYDQDEYAPEIFSSEDGKAHLNLVTCEGTWIETQKTYSNRLVIFTDKE